MNRYCVPSDREAIALVGIGCRFPGHADSPQAFWDLLLHETDAVQEISPERWDLRRFYHPDPMQPGKMYTRHGAFLEGIDLFDAAFFGIPPAEASRLDPQHRLLLEVSWEALEDARLVPSKLADSQTGVFVGICTNEYGAMQDPATFNAYSNIGNASSIASNRLSYFFNFHGPSLSVDTACSSSLVAMHLACESLWRGECSMALAGGVSMHLNPKLSIGFCKAQMLSSSGRCHTFDAEADGYVRGEGAGMVILKPLSQALAENDPIYAVIRATGINQDGRTPALPYPSREAQEALLRKVYTEAGVFPEQVHYVEAHGTGTVGDVVETQALGTVLGASRAKGQWLRIGSVKTNIGHLEGASGMAGLIKTVLALKHRRLPANLHFHTPHPDIPFEALHLKVQNTTEIVPDDGTPLIAGVNNFGFGGTNAHIVLEEFLPPARQEQGIDPAHQPPAFLFPLSARSPEALRALVQAYLTMLRTDPIPTLRDLCFTVGLRREHHPFRLALVVRSLADLIEQLEAFLAQEKRAGIITGLARAHKAPKLAFVFSGNGPQWWAMGRQLLDQEPCFREVVERCDHLLRPYTGWSLVEELRADEAASRMHRTDVAQIALFAVQIGLVALWKSWGIEPQAALGHSVGEIAAAYVAGVLTLEDAIRVVFHRSRLQELTAGAGKMVAIGLSEHEVRQQLQAYGDRITLASVNSPHAVTLSGKVEALQQLVDQLEAQEVFCRFLDLDYAFHSPAMDPIQAELLDALHGLQARPATISFVSTVTGGELAGPECGADYWWKNIRCPVQFEAGMQRLIEEGSTVFLEVGPHPVLVNYMRECLAERNGHTLFSLRRKEEEYTTLLNTLGSLYTLGFPISWEALTQEGKLVPLPLYPWQRERYWNLSEEIEDVHPLLGKPLETVPGMTWENELDKPHLLYLQDHRVGNMALFPAAGYLEAIRAAAQEWYGEDGCTAEQIHIYKPLLLGDAQSCTLRTVLSPEDGNVQIHSQQRDTEQSVWGHYASAQIGRLKQMPKSILTLQEIRQRCSHAVSVSDFYQESQQRGLHYGPAFQLLTHLFTGELEALGTIAPAETEWESFAEYSWHPALLDTCIQTVAPLVWTGLPSQRDAEHVQSYIPIGVDRVRFSKPPQPHRGIYSYVRIVKQGANYFKANYTILDEEEQVILEMTGVCFQAIEAAQFSNVSFDGNALQDWLYEEYWQPAPLPSQRNTKDVLPAPSQFVTHIQADIEQICQEVPLAHWYQQAQPRLNQLCLAYVLAALHQLGWHFERRKRISVSSLRQKLGILSCYEPFLTVWCGILADNGILQAEHDEWVVMRTPVLEDPEQLLGTLIFEYPGNHAEITLITRIGNCLTKILTGEISPLSMLSSDSDFSAFEHFFESGLIERRHQSLLQKTLETLVGKLPQGKILRILEIGAGTGGITTHILPIFPAERVAYTFTDASEAFLQRAQQKYRDYPFMHYQICDLQRDIREQGFEPHTFDVIIASHALHTAPDIRQTLLQVRQLLSSEGWLCCIEPTDGGSPFLSLVLGQQPTYWDVLDTELRPAHPLLSEQQWQHVLTEAGFTDISMLSPKKEMSQPDRVCLLAQAPVQVQKGVPIRSEVSTRATWILFADEEGVAAYIKDQLAEHVEHIIWVSRGQRYQRLSAHQFVVRSCQDEDFQSLFTTLRDEGVADIQMVYLWGLSYSLKVFTPEMLSTAVNEGCLNILKLVQACTSTLEHLSTRLWIVTSGVQTLRGDESQISLEQTPLYGLARTLINEHPELRSTLIDIGRPRQQRKTLSYAADDLDALVEELWAQTGESEVLVRGTDRFVNRVKRGSLDHQMRADEVTGLPDTSYGLEVPMQGKLDSLHFQTVPRKQPGPGEVEIAVSAVGLNFRDVVLAMRLVPVDVLEESFGEYSLGWECTGQIVAVGEGVEDLQIGDKVLTTGSPSFRPFVTRNAQVVFPIPRVSHEFATALSLEETVTLPTVFQTAHYALHYLARIRAGERVLIHGAAGGVGLAAIQIVQHVGGEIFATAGTPEKRAYLRALGVPHILDSRSLTFADEIMQLTGGEGVDIVLNSLMGEAVAKSLSVLRPLGRFIEMGKRDFLENKPLRLQPFQRSLSYFAIDMNKLLKEDLPLARQLAQEVLALVDQGIYHPLPYRLFQAHQIVEAFRYMQQSRQIGKIVVSMRHSYARVTHRAPTQPFVVRPDATYLVTGGLSGFGLATARWLVQRGARHLALVNRSGVTSSEAIQAIEEMGRAGVRVFATAVDVTQEQAVVALFKTLKKTFPPLRGVIHAAMVLDDRPIRQLDTAAFKSALEPKMLGAWHLHTQTINLPLDFFVLYSSITALIGNVGQANYVAGNLFLDALARYRHARGLPALAIRWGALKDVGYAARHAETLTLLQRGGVEGITSAQALQALERLLQEPHPVAQVAAIEWKKLSTILLSEHGRDRWASLLATDGNWSHDSGERSSDFFAMFSQAEAEARQALVVARLQQLLTRVVGLAATAIDGERSLGDLGIDSLTAMELRTAIKQDFGIELTVMQLLRDQSISGFAALVTRLVQEKLEGKSEPSTITQTAEKVVAEVVKEVVNQ